MGFVRYFSDVKDDKHTIETCFYNGNVRFFHLFWNGVSGSSLPLKVKSENSIQLFVFFTYVPKQIIKEKLSFDD